MGGFFPKVDEKYGDEDRKYNRWGCSHSIKSTTRSTFHSYMGKVIKALKTSPVYVYAMSVWSTFESKKEAL